ncbi:MAG: 2OG-Fe dioxygenase family protein [Chloroflexota bacterium]
MAMTHTLQIEAQHDIYGDLLHDDYSIIHAADLHMPPHLQAAWQRLQAEYPAMPADKFLPGNGAYRFRRYDSFSFHPATGELTLKPHKTYFQDTDINHVTGGIVRDFAPLTETIASNPFLHELIRFDFAQFPVDLHMRGGEWQVDVHLIRVVAQAGETGHPTPEGVHRDGAEFVTVHIAERDNVTGGEVSIYDDAKNPRASFTLHNVMDAYLFRDSVLWHGVTPIAPIVGEQGVRSILTFDYHFVG